MPKLRLSALLRGVLGREEVELKKVAAVAAVAIALGVGVSVGAMHATSPRVVVVQRSASLTLGSAADCSYACPSGTELVNAGYAGVLRYLSWDSGKNASAAQVSDYHAHGLGVGLNWESTADHALSGSFGGKMDATQALIEANALHAPSATVIYFSLDFDATPAEQTTINAYFAGVDTVLVRSRVGAYGGYWPLSRLVGTGLVSYYWQTTAWSGGILLPARSLYQFGYGLMAGRVDRDAELGNWGEWLANGTVATKGDALPPSTSPPPASSACSFGSSGWTSNPWPNGDGNQTMTVYKYGGSVACSSPQFSYGLQYKTASGAWANVGWDPWTTRTSDYWALSYYVTPCNRPFRFMVALRSGTGKIASYKQVAAWIINRDCA